MAKRQRAQNEAGPGIRILAGMLALVMTALVLHQISTWVAAASFSDVNGELLLGALLFGFVSGTVAIRGFLPPGLFALIPGFRGAMNGKARKER